MSTKTNLRERICAAVLAFVMIVVSVLPNVALVAQAEEGDAYFFVYEEYVPDPVNAPGEVVNKPVKGATLQIGVESYTTDENGKCIVSGAEDGAGIAISRTGYSYNEGMSGTLIVQAGTTEESPQEIKLEMNDISLSADALILVKGTEDNFISFVEGTKIEDANDLGYTWSAADESSNEKVDVNPSTGSITAKEKGNAIIKVARNSKTATKEITIKEQPVLTASVSPIERGGDAPTTDVNVTVNGIPEGGEAVISATFVSGTATTEPKTVSSVSNTATFTIPEGKHQVLFTARYAGNEEQFYLPAEVTTELYTYKINKAISVADDFLTEYTYGDPAIALADKVIGADGRNVSFTVTEGDGVLIINADNTLEIVGAGTAKVTITAAGNDDYNEATAECLITVKKKELGAIKVGDIVWSSAAKVYDSNNDISLTGCLTSGHGLKENDSIVITAKAKIKKADGTDGTDAGEYTTFDYVSAEIPESANYSFVLDETDKEGLTLSNDGKIVIAPRNLYIEVTGDTPSIQYGKTNKEIEETLQKKAEIQLVSENGAVEEDINSGLLVGETVDITEAVTVALKDKDTLTYYVNNYQDVIQPVVIENKENLGNYKLVVGNPIENYSGDLSITCQVVEDSDYSSMVQIEDSRDGVYKTDSEVWVLNGTDLKISVASNSMYTDVYMKRTEDESYQENKISLSTEEKGNIKVTDIAVYLSNQNDLSNRTRTTGNAESETATDNTLPETIIIDNKLPEVQFDGLGVFGNANNWSGDLFYKKFTNAAYEQPVVLKDDGSGITKDENGNAQYDYKLYAVTADTAGTGEAIRTAAISDEGWTSSSANKINVPANTEGYYVILVRAKDNVGNQAVYCSNGIVVDVTSPTSVTIKGLDKDKAYNAEQEYTITAEDVLSRINKIVVEVLDKDNNLVEGSAETRTDSFTVDNLTLSEDLVDIGLTKEQLGAVANPYTLNAKISETNGISKVKVTVYDTAGNVLDSDEQELNVDTNSPTAVYSFDNNEYESVGDKNYFKENRTMTIIYTERNFDPEKAGFTIKVDGISYKVDLKNWPAELADLGIILDSYHEGDDSQYGEDEYTDARELKYRIEFGVDGAEHEYGIESMSIEDGAGNSGTITESEGTVTDFVIDGKAPTIEISYDLTDADAKNQDQTLYGAERTMTVTYTEKYFDAEYVMLKLKPETEKTLADWLGASEEGVTVEKDNDNSTDDKYVYKVTFGGENLDIDYEVSTSISDYAGNQNSEITYKDGEAVDKSKENFVVDMKAPVVTVQYQAVGENGSEEYNETFTVNPGSERVYRNKTIQAVVTIEERHFAEENAEEVKAEVEEEAFDVANATVNDITDQEGSAKTASNWTPVDDEPDTYTQTFRFSEDANYRFNFAFTDVAGNKTYMAGSEGERYYFTVDKTPPTVKINEETSFLDRIFAFFFNKDNETVDYTVSMRDATSPVYAWYAKDDESEPDNEGKIAGIYTEEELKNLSWIQLNEGHEISCKDDVGRNIPVNDGEQFIPYVKVTDKAGNTTYVNANGVVYESNESKIEVTGVKNGDIFNADDTVEFSFKVNDKNETDVYSGLKEVYYQVIKEGNLPDSLQEEGSDTAIQPINEYISAESEKPEDFFDVNGDSVTGFDSVTVHEDASFFSKLRKPDYEGNDIEIPKELYNSNNVKIRIFVTDNSGNKAETEVPIIIDTTAPEIQSVQFDKTEEDGCYQDRKMTIKYKERNFDPSLAMFSIIENNGETIKKSLKSLEDLMSDSGKVEGITVEKVEDTQGEREKEALTDERLITYDLKFEFEETQEKDIKYEVTPSIEDGAGNVNEQPAETQVFTIDNTKPEINVSYDNNEPENGKYFNTERTMIVSFTENNYDEKLVTFDITVDGVKQEVMTIAGLRVENEYAINIMDENIKDNVHVYDITFGAQDKDFAYQIVPKIEDQAGNEGTVTYEDGTVVSGKDEEEEFVVDMLPPEINVSYKTVAPEQDITGDISTQVQDSMYKNSDIKAIITITEHNFGEDNFTKEEMILSESALDVSRNPAVDNNGNKVTTTHANDVMSVNDWTVTESNPNEYSKEFEYTEDANYSLELEYTDLAGNSATYVKHYFTVDKTAPSGKIKVSSLLEAIEKQINYPIKFSIFNQNAITVTFVSDDDTSPHKQGYYMYDPQEDIHGEKVQLEVSKDTSNVDNTTLETLEGNRITDWASTNYDATQKQTADISVNTERIPYMRLQDKAGNVVFYTADGIIVDDQKPEAAEGDEDSLIINIQTPDSSNGEEIYAGDVSFDIQVIDPSYGEGDGTYAGINSVSYQIKKYDAAKGEMVETKEVQYYKDDTTVEENGISRIPVSDRKKEVVWSDLTVLSADNNSNRVDIIVTVVDNAGNEYTETKTIAIDITAPELIVSYDNNDVKNGRYFNSDRVMTVTCTERNFYEDGLTFDVTVDGVTKDEQTISDLRNEGFDVISVESGPKDSQSGTDFRYLTDERTNEYIIRFGGKNEDTDHDYVIVPKLVDKVNREANVTYEDKREIAPNQAFTIDEIAPAAEVVYKVDGKSVTPGRSEDNRIYESVAEMKAYVTILERNFATQKGNFSDNPEQMNLTFSALNRKGDTVSTTDYAQLAKEPWDSKDSINKKTFTFSEDANYTFEFVYQDLAGNKVTYDARYFTVDDTPPSGEINVPDSDVSKGGFWSQLFNTIYNFFTRKDHTSTMSSNDETAGIAGTYYYIDNSTTGNIEKDCMRWDELDEIKTWASYSEGIKVSPDSQSVLYEKIVDKAGNVTYVNAMFGIIADKVAPTVELTDKSPVRNGIHSGDVTVGVTVTDPKVEGVYAGINKVEYTIESTTNTIASESGTVLMTYTNSENERNLTGTGNIIVHAGMFNSNDVTVRVTAYDNAGNSYEKALHLKIDITPTDVHFDWNPSGSPHGEYYNTTRVLTVTVQERNFDEREVNWSIDTIEGPYPSISGWSHTGDSASDSYTHTCTVEFAADGVYTVSMNCIDLAGNQSNTESEGRFVIDKTAPIINVTFDNNNSANGKYYNASRTATITINEHNFNGTEVQTAITSNSVTPGVNGWGSSGDIRTATVPFTTDGAYSFTVNYTDLAGNPATVYNVDEFVVDLTKPEIEIFDIIDKSANNGEVAPGVRYSDTNYDVNGVSITYSGPKHKTKAVDGTRTSIPNGESIKMDDFSHTQETDDLYTMVAKVTDLAGNSDEKEVTFSVNRFGSNFIFSKVTEEFLDDYYNNEEENLVVTEINVDTLTHRGITCGHDGNMTDFKEGTDYTVKESGGEVSWKSYEYTIKKENFEKEGLYNITIDSVDRATNEVNNKIKEAEIEFVIDKTAPTVVITGVEDDGQYRTNERDIMVSAADNVAVELVEVYVDDAGKPAESYDAKTIQNQKGELPYTLTSSSDWQKVKVVAVDMAGNITDTSRPEGSDNEEWLSVLVTSNIFVQFYRNTVLVIGTAVVLAGLLGVAIFLILAKGRKKEQ